MKMKKTTIILIMVLIASSFVLAETLQNPRPLITVIFNESASIINATLKDTQNNYFNITLESFNATRTEFVYKTQDRLVNGDYTITVVAQDDYGNIETSSKTFTIDYSGIAFWVVEPENNITNQRFFNITIETTVEASCRYDYDYQKPFSLFREFTTTGSFTHTLLNYNWSEYEDYGKHFYLVCNTTEDLFIGTNGEYDLQFSLDESIPEITALYADPNPVADYVNDSGFWRLMSTVTLETNEPTICKYSSNDVSDYWLMESTFPGHAQKEYKTTHEVTFTYPTQTEGAFDYLFACEDTANLNSSVRDVQILVNTSIPMAIMSFTPTGYVSGNSVTLEATTNKMTFCKFFKNETIVTSTGQGKTHKITLTGLSDGSHTYKVNCTRLPDVVESTTTFTIDTSAPTTPVVDDSSPYSDNPSKTKDDDRLRVRWNSSDPESGISEYKYMLKDSSGNIIVDWSYSADENTWMWVENLDLTNGTYYFRVNATNNAGLSSVGQSDGVTVDLGFVPEEAENCADGILNNEETDTDCGGPNCGACGSGKDCENNRDCRSGSCENDECTEDICDNNELDGDETDVDCGGSCAERNLRCGLGEICFMNDDCESNLCIDDMCDSGENDYDNDTIPNEEDDDKDGDGKNNSNDPDDDNDGLCDTADSPLNDATCTGDDDDDDGDGVKDPDDKDTNDDLDDDGKDNKEDEDIDGDGKDNDEDNDDDNDGLCDTADSPLNEDTCTGDDDDDDNDGVEDKNDKDTNDDLDNDGIKNEDDDDIDGDGKDNDEDPDDDNDGLCDTADSPLNEDTCTGDDDDDDNDGILDTEDLDNVDDWCFVEAEGVVYKGKCDDIGKDGTDIKDGDLDNDGTPNNHDSDMDGDGTQNIDDSDNDNDGLSNEDDPDDDNDGIPDEMEDSDGDGMPDMWELAHGLNPFISDANLDLDGDSLSNLDEYKYSTDPGLADSDGDGISDAIELSEGMDPTAAGAEGKSHWGSLLMLLLALLLLVVVGGYFGYSEYKKRQKEQFRVPPPTTRPVMRLRKGDKKHVSKPGTTVDLHRVLQEKEKKKVQLREKVFDRFKEKAIAPQPAKLDRLRIKDFDDHKKEKKPEKAVPKVQKPTEEWVSIDKLQKPKKGSKLDMLSSLVGKEGKKRPVDELERLFNKDAFKELEKKGKKAAIDDLSKIIKKGALKDLEKTGKKASLENLSKIVKKDALKEMKKKVRKK